MKRYAISYYDNFTASIVMEIVDAENDLEALKIAYIKLTRNQGAKDIKDIPTLKVLARLYDGAIEAIEVYEPDHVFATETIKKLFQGSPWIHHRRTPSIAYSS